MKILLIILLAAVWIYVLTVLYRTKLTFWFFLTGSVGTFLLSMLILEPVLMPVLQKSVSAAAGLLGDLTHLYASFFSSGILFVRHGTGSLSLYVDFECSGVIEILAYLSLLWFFPVYRWEEKVVHSFGGVLAMYLANVVRIFIIAVMVHYGGMDIYWLAHSVVGRLFFYACTIAIYFYVFTRTQVVRQKVGAFRYEH